MSQAKYSELERAVRVPTSDELDAMARALKVDVAAIRGEAVSA